MYPAAQLPLFPDRATEAHYGVPQDAVIDAHVAERVLARTLGIRFDVRSIWPIIRALICSVSLRRRMYGGLELTFENEDPLYIYNNDVELGYLLDHSFGVQAYYLVALALARLYSESEYRVLLLQPRWRAVLNDLDDESHQTPATKKTAKPGWIRVILRSERGDPYGPHAREPLFGALGLLLIHRGRGGKTLKPRKAPATLETFRTKVSDANPGDERVIWLAERRRLMHARAKRTGAQGVTRTDDALMEALSAVSEVYYEDRQITVARADWSAMLVLVDGPEGPWLDWHVPVLDWWSNGPGYVLDAKDHFWRIPEGRRDALHALLRAIPLTVPFEDLNTFVETFVRRAKLPVVLQTRHVKIQTGKPRPRVMLTDDNGRLRVDLAFSYGDIDLPPDAGSTMLLAGSEVQRDPDAEATYRDEFLAVVGANPGWFDGEAALDFIANDLPKLDWPVDQDKKLGFKVRGSATATVHFSGTRDWFDVDVELRVDSVTVPLARAVAAWRAGQRYVRLKDGSHVRLPDEWLKQHGEVVEELIDLRRAQKKKLGPHIAPLMVDLLAQAEGPVEKLERWRKTAARLKTFNRVPNRAVPKGLKAELRDYQVRGYRWLRFVADMGLGGVLADDMGLGKTLQMLTWILSTRTGRKKPKTPVLVVAPTSVIYNWLLEVEKFTPSLTIHLHHGPNRGELPKDVDIIVTNYALLRRDIEAICAIDWHTLILDEAQAIKNPSSQLAQAARSVQATHRFALTGTPLENHLMELWSLFEWLMPGFFGGRPSFTKRYVKPIQQIRDAEALTRLRTRIRPFMLRRLKREVATELPPRQEQILYCELGSAQRALYDAIREDYRDKVLHHLEKKGLGRSTIQVLEALTRLRQACCDPALLPSNWGGVQEAAKMDLLHSLIDRLIDEHHRALVFSQWPGLLKRVAARLTERHIRYLYLDGQTRKRGGLQAEWNDPMGPPIFLISIKAGGSGLNLTGADHVIHMDPWWNPAVEAQATDRAHRIGQDKPVVVYKLVAKGTVEEKILELQDRKRALFEATVETDRVQVDGLTREDLEAVFTGPQKSDRALIERDP